MKRVEAVAGELVTVAAIGSLSFIAVETGADPTTVVGAVSGLGGYRLYRRADERDGEGSG